MVEKCFSLYRDSRCRAHALKWSEREFWKLEQVRACLLGAKHVSSYYHPIAVPAAAVLKIAHFFTRPFPLLVAACAVHAWAACSPKGEQVWRAGYFLNTHPHGVRRPEPSHRPEGRAAKLCPAEWGCRFRDLMRLPCSRSNSPGDLSEIVYLSK